MGWERFLKLAVPAAATAAGTALALQPEEAEALTPRQFWQGIKAIPGAQELARSEQAQIAQAVRRVPKVALQNISSVAPASKELLEGKLAFGRGLHRYFPSEGVGEIYLRPFKPAGKLAAVPSTPVHEALHQLYNEMSFQDREVLTQAFTRLTQHNEPSRRAFMQAVDVNIHDPKELLSELGAHALLGNKQHLELLPADTLAKVLSLIEKYRKPLFGMMAATGGAAMLAQPQEAEAANRWSYGARGIHNLLKSGKKIGDEVTPKELLTVSGLSSRARPDHRNSIIWRLQLSGDLNWISGGNFTRTTPTGKVPGTKHDVYRLAEGSVYKWLQSGKARTENTVEQVHKAVGQVQRAIVRSIRPTAWNTEEEAIRTLGYYIRQNTQGAYVYDPAALREQVIETLMDKGILQLRLSGGYSLGPNGRRLLAVDVSPEAQNAHIQHAINEMAERVEVAARQMPFYPARFMTYAIHPDAQLRVLMGLQERGFELRAPELIDTPQRLLAAARGGRIEVRLPYGTRLAREDAARKTAVQEFSEAPLALLPEVDYLERLLKVASASPAGKVDARDVAAAMPSFKQRFPELMQRLFPGGKSADLQAIKKVLDTVEASPREKIYRYSWSGPTSAVAPGEYTHAPGWQKRYLRVLYHPEEKEALGQFSSYTQHGAPMTHEKIPTVGWFKIHELGSSWRVEEIQSDFLSNTRQAAKLSAKKYSAEELKAGALEKDPFYKQGLEIEKQFRDWADYGLATLLKEARENGVPKVEIIGKENVQKLWKGHLGESKAIQYYRDLAKRFGFQLDEKAWSWRVPALIFTAGAGAAAALQPDEAEASIKTKAITSSLEKLPQSTLAKALIGKTVEGKTISNVLKKGDWRILVFSDGTYATVQKDFVESFAKGLGHERYMRKFAKPGKTMIQKYGQVERADFWRRPHAKPGEALSSVKKYKQNLTELMPNNKVELVTVRFKGKIYNVPKPYAEWLQQRFPEMEVIE